MDEIPISLPHGGELIDLLVDSQRAVALKELSQNLPDITLSDHHLCDLELIATGAFSPLNTDHTRFPIINNKPATKNQEPTVATMCPE